MAKTNEQQPAQEPVKLSSEPVLPVREFCARLSETDRRVELVSAFYKVELAAGTVVDTEKNFQDRYNNFINQPA